MPRTPTKSCCSPAESCDAELDGSRSSVAVTTNQGAGHCQSGPPVPQLTAFGGRVAGECAQLAEDLSRFLGAPAVPREVFGRGPAFRDNLDVLRFRECISKAGRNREKIRLFASAAKPSLIGSTSWSYVPAPRSSPSVARLTGVSPFASTNWSRP
jgi:hypothetical protein